MNMPDRQRMHDLADRCENREMPQPVDHHWFARRPCATCEHGSTERLWLITNERRADVGKGLAIVPEATGRGDTTDFVAKPGTRPVEPASDGLS
jgi:hypothetical protein